MQVRYQAALRPDPQNPEVEFAKESRSRDAIPQVAEERRRMGAPLLAYHLNKASSSRGALGGSRTLPCSAHRTDYPQSRCDSIMRIIRLHGLALAPRAVGG